MGICDRGAIVCIIQVFNRCWSRLFCFYTGGFGADESCLVTDFILFAQRQVNLIKQASGVDFIIHYNSQSI